VTLRHQEITEIEDVYQGVDFSYSDFTNCMNVETTFTDCMIVDCDFVGLDSALQLNKVTARNSDFTGATMSMSTFKDVDLSYSIMVLAELDHSTFDGVSLKEADLRNSFFKYCLMPKVDFSGADLRGADFTGADLREADFRDAKLQGAIFCEADLRGAKFEGAATNSSTRFERAIEPPRNLEGRFSVVGYISLYH
jgi:uncharacterized protein YjbI with pentapeptide repeats